MEATGKWGKVVEWGRIEEKETSTQDEPTNLTLRTWA